MYDSKIHCFFGSLQLHADKIPLSNDVSTFHKHCWQVGTQSRNAALTSSVSFSSLPMSSTFPAVGGTTVISPLMHRRRDLGFEKKSSSPLTHFLELTVYLGIVLLCGSGVQSLSFCRGFTAMLFEVGTARFDLSTCFVAKSLTLDSESTLWSVITSSWPILLAISRWKLTSALEQYSSSSPALLTSCPKIPEPQLSQICSYFPESLSQCAASSLSPSMWLKTGNWLKLSLLSASH